MSTWSLFAHQCSKRASITKFWVGTYLGRFSQIGLQFLLGQNWTWVSQKLKAKPGVNYGCPLSTWSKERKHKKVLYNFNTNKLCILRANYIALGQVLTVRILANWKCLCTLQKVFMFFKLVQKKCRVLFLNRRNKMKLQCHLDRIFLLALISF